MNTPYTKINTSKWRCRSPNPCGEIVLNGVAELYQTVQLAELVDLSYVSNSVSEAYELWVQELKRNFCPADKSDALNQCE